jgi:7,8-dihydropterin-6-yl-methyl-4-(beta-D-ribofuranosyl)aminobenzene 5'-phosphate synthase
MTKLTVLTENTAGGFFQAEHGLSYLIEHNGFSILFDTGHTDVFLKNATKLNVNINDVNYLVLSHGHWDHGNGLRFIENLPLITHPNSFIKRYRKHDKSNIGLLLNKTEIEKKFNLITSSMPYNITEDIIFLGEIPRINNFEAQTTSFVDSNGNDDFVVDDSAIVLIQNTGISIVTGCSHSGICNITDYARKVTGIDKVNTVIGGFHLKYNNLQTQKTIDFFKNLKIKNIYPSHCTELPALAEFYKYFNIKQVKTGMIINI